VSVSLSISLKTREDDFTKKVPKFLSLPLVQLLLSIRKLVFVSHDEAGFLGNDSGAFLCVPF